MNELLIGNSDEYIRLYDREPADLSKSLSYFSAEVIKRGLSCHARIYSYKGDGITKYFSDLSQNWKGWNGEKIWGSIETQLTFTATHDGISCVHLSVYLSPSMTPGSWSIEAPILLDLGSLENLSGSVSKFVGKT